MTVRLWTWLGFFLMSWGPNGLFIFLVSCANLIPRSQTRCKLRSYVAARQLDYVPLPMLALCFNVNS